MMTVKAPVTCPQCQWQGERLVPNENYAGPAGPCPKCTGRLRAIGNGRAPLRANGMPEATEQMQRATGEFGRAKVWRNKQDLVRAKVTCAYDGCKEARGGRPWMSASEQGTHGQGSTIEFALDLWAKHLRRTHDKACPWELSPQNGLAVKAQREEEKALWARLGIAPPTSR